LPCSLRSRSLGIGRQISRPEAFRQLVKLELRTKGKSVPINKVAWDKIGQVKEPGRYNYPFGWLTITAADIAIWELFPTAAFTLVLQVGSRDEYRLGAFDLQPPPFELDSRD